MEIPFQPEGLSKLHFYSTGIVAKNKDLESDLIEVTAIEDNSYLDGELTDQIEKVEGEGTDKDGKTFNTTVETTNTIKAKWLSFTDTNRMTSPDVRRGEKVVIWRFGDTDQFWWCTEQQDRKLRRLETVIWGFSNCSKENEESNHSNMYWVEISTHRKVIRFHTSKNDGEPFAWDIQLDTKKGVFSIDDNDGGYFFYDAKNRHFRFENKDKSYLEIDKKNATWSIPEKIKVLCKDFEMVAKNSIKMSTKDYSLTTQKFHTKASKWNTTVPSANFSQHVRSGATVYWGGISYAKEHVPDRT
jgi:hypothetical protein